MAIESGSLATARKKMESFFKSSSSDSNPRRASPGRDYALPGWAAQRNCTWNRIPRGAYARGCQQRAAGSHAGDPDSMTIALYAKQCSLRCSVFMQFDSGNSHFVEMRPTGQQQVRLGSTHIAAAHCSARHTGIARILRRIADKTHSFRK
jgi:hypothetical protein